MTTTQAVPRALLADLGQARRVEDLLAAIEEHDNYTGSHSCRVSAYAGMLGRLIGLNDESVALVKRAGLVHDIGKLNTPREVLRRKGPLSADEMTKLKMHPIGGALMLSSAGHHDLVPAVLHHHERWDGRGYPTGVSGIDIPLEARIIFVADAFDAMTSARTYGEVVGITMAVEEIQRCAGWQFDPLVAKTMQVAYEKGWLDTEGISTELPKLPA